MAEEINFPKPPEDITPKALFTEWLPAQIADYKDMAKEMGGNMTTSISMKITGDNGGDWCINIDKGDVTITEGIKDDSLVTIRMSDSNFADAVSGKKFQTPTGMPGSMGGGMSNPLEAIGQMKDKVDALKSINGSIGFKIEGDSDPFEVMIKFAGPMTDEATATLIISEETAAEMASGELNPQSAFMSGKLQIQGDMGLMMQLAQFAM